MSVWCRRCAGDSGHKLETLFKNQCRASRTRKHQEHTFHMITNDQSDGRRLKVPSKIVSYKEYERLTEVSGTSTLSGTKKLDQKPMS